MKKVILKRLVLSDFKAQNSDLVFDEKINTIVGRNGTGKTNLMRAWFWLLSGYTDPLLPKNSELYDNKVELNENTPLACVKAFVEIDGVECTIERKAEAKFVRKQGTDVYEKAPSDKYTLLVDDIETSAADWKTFCSRNFCDIDLLTYCLSGKFFACLAEENKDKARALLEQIVGVVSDSELKGDYSEILPKLQTYSISEIINQAQNTLKPLKLRLKEIPAIIERNQTDLANYNQTDFEAINSQMNEVREKISGIDNQMLAASDALKPLLEKRRKQMDDKMAAENKLYEAKRKYNSDIKSGAQDIISKMDNIDAINRERIADNNRGRQRMDSIANDITQQKNDLVRHTKRREELIKECNEVKERIFKPSVCSYCGQELPIEKQEEMRAKFNAQKESELQRLINEGKSVRERMDACEAQIKKLEAEQAAGFTEQPLESKDELQKELDKYNSQHPIFENTEEYAQLKKAVDDCVIDDEQKADNTALLERKRELLSQLEELNRSYGLKTKRDALQNEIKQLEEEKTEVGLKVIKQEKILHQVDEYIRERADIVSSRINSSFVHTKIMMQRRQKDGSLVDDCILCQNNDIKYNTSNGAAQAMIEAEVQRFFCQSYGVNMPLWIDESNTINEDNMPLNTDGQTILIRCSDDSNLQVIR